MYLSFWRIGWFVKACSAWQETSNLITSKHSSFSGDSLLTWPDVDLRSQHQSDIFVGIMQSTRDDRGGDGYRGGGFARIHHGHHQVCSLTAFLKPGRAVGANGTWVTRTTETSPFLTNAQSRYASVVPGVVPGPLQLAIDTWRCACISVITEARYVSRLRALEGCCCVS